MFHLRLIKARSYTGIVKATAENPDVYTDDKQTADYAVGTGYFSLVDTEETSTTETPGTEQSLNNEAIEDMTVDELKKIAKEMGIAKTSSMKRNELIEAITEHSAVAEEVTDADYGEDDE